MIICSQCGGTLEKNGSVCGECGARVATVRVNDARPVNIPSARPLPAQRQPVDYARVAASETPATKPQTKPIVWVAVTVGVLVLVIISVVGFPFQRRQTTAGTSTPKLAD